MKTTNSDFNLIMESWRKYADTAAPQPFPLLEQYERKELTEAQLAEAWERDLLLEMQEVFNEGMADTLKQGMAALAAGAKEEWAIVKDAFGAAMKKINDFLASLVFQALELIRKTKEFMAPVSKIILKAWGAVKKFCGAHPILCKAVAVLLVMVAAVCLMGASAHAAEAVDATGGISVSPEGGPISDTSLDLIKGCMHVLEQDADGIGSDLAGRAIMQVEELSQADSLTQIQTISGDTGELVNTCFDYLTREAGEGGPSASMLNKLQDVGEKVHAASKSFTQDVTGADYQHTEKAYSALAPK